MCSIILKLEKNGSIGYTELDSYAIYDYKKSNQIVGFSSIKLNKLVLDNLLMHRLIDVSYDMFYTYGDSNEKYNTLFDSTKIHYKLEPNTNLSFDKGLVRLTDLGENFIDICLS